MLKDEPQKLWIPEREKFLKEFIRLKGHGDTMLYQTCQGLPGCPNEAVVCCRDCEGLQLYCQGCTVMQHTVTPLYHMEIWTGTYFHCISLHDLGLCVQLGHPSGVMCCNPASAFDDDFTILEINGIHSVTLNFCNCTTAQTHDIQLLHARLYPATTTNPRTTATFHLLDHFQMYTFESKGSAFEYYQSLSRLTDNTGTRQPKDHYDGILSTKEGELAVLCPACPQPGRNLPQDWENAPPNVKWLYGLFLAIDTNFRLCHCNKSSDQEVLDASSRQLQEKSSCAGHNAINLADTKNARGMAATGVGAIVCARHNLTHPSMVGDLQKGEKYVNMDYLFFSTLQHASDIHVLNISYDIVCQWSKHLWMQMSRYPSRIHLQPDNKKLKEAIPECDQHIFDLQDFEEAIPPASLAAWQVMITEWEQDRSKPNPFELEASVATQASVRLELSQLEGQQLSHGVNTSLHPDISPSVLVAVEIDLKSLQ
ncbi:uncharacterized protein EDB91DRAFT_1251446 [Suillus paluster]|uniref:uncharacterized protein n=1 Tax=Suillus paluster TaxID=48578 RepID=UPI001B8645CD|nr:uncharacterized protein EDB91DRAFT_1251446 [Suillus paluster]KAG1733204.1 hypothetical protein EDB91DRAFT_1251446 [Suillus paluster]